MFCLLEISERRYGLKEKLFGRFLKDIYELKTVPVFKGAPFYKLNVTVGKMGVDWQQVRFFVGKCANRLLVNSAVDLDETVGVGRYEKKTLYPKLMQNTFITLLKQQNKIFDDLCFIDKKAQSAELLYKLVPYFNKISVVTDNKPQYDKTCDRILEETGLCVTTQSEIQNACVKIDTERNIMTVITENNIYNITDGDGFSVPTIYENLYDETVEKLLFYSALYEFCGVFELADLSFETIVINGEKKGINEVIFT